MVQIVFLFSPFFVVYFIYYFSLRITSSLSTAEHQQQPEPRRSCLEHYLNGANNDVVAVLPLNGGIRDSAPVWLECQFPPFSSQSQSGSVATVVHNALNRWFTLGDDEKRTVEYQIRDREWLAKLIADSEDCTQQLYIKWPQQRVEMATNGNNNAEKIDGEEAQHEDTVVFSKPEAESKSNALAWHHKDIEFSVETLQGQTRTFKVNSTNLDTQSMEIVLLTGSGELPVLHIVSPKSFDKEKVEIRLTPLICRRPIVARGGRRCLLAMTSDIRIDVPSAMKKHADATTLSFAFRINSAPGNKHIKLMNVVLRNGEQVDVNLVDGYLIIVNRIVHAVKLLTDGQWHTAYLDLATLSLRFDSPSQTAVSLFSPSLRRHIEHSREGLDPAEVNILVKGEITSIRLTQSPMHDDEGVTLCADSELLYIRNLPQVYMTPVCSPGEEEMSVCNCHGPISALAPGPETVSCAAPKPENAYHLSRQHEKLAFFMIPNFSAKSPISIMFKSESDTGLLLFGLTTLGKREGYHGRDKINRLQVHFVGRTMFVASCEGDEICYSCFIIRDRDTSLGDWIRVSLFYYENYQFMTVDDQICLLSPNSAIIDSSELYKVSPKVSNVLLVGGTYYAKDESLKSKVNDGFRRDFHEKTKEKPQSLKGCISEVRINGKIVNLEESFQQQVHRIVTNKEATSVFSMEKGCSACPLRCNGAPCEIRRDVISDVVCNCAQIYSTLDPNTGTCGRSYNINSDEALANADLFTKQALKLSLIADFNVPFSAEPFHLTTTVDSQHERLPQLKKVWMLIRLPELNSELHTFLRLGYIKVSVGNNGKLIVVEVETAHHYKQIREEFVLENLDVRLHLLSFEMKPAIGEAMYKSVLTVRLDNNQRELQLEEIPIYSTSHLSILPYLIPSSKYSDESAEYKDSDRGGCLSELVLNYEPNDEKQTRHHKFLLDQHYMQTNYLLKMIEKLLYDMKIKTNEEYNTDHSSTAFYQSLFLNKKSCGISDPLLWFGNSSSYGSLTNYNPGGLSSFSFSFIVTFCLILLVLVLLICYVYKRFIHVKKRNHKSNDSRIETDSLIEEKKPLRTPESYVESHKWHSNEEGSTAETAYEDQNDSDFHSIPSRPTEPLIIDRLRSSPKSRHRMNQNAVQTNAPLSLSSGSPYSFPSTAISSAASPTNSAAGVSPATDETRIFNSKAAQQAQHPGPHSSHSHITAPLVSHDADEL